jgi:hypothetical protein
VLRAFNRENNTEIGMALFLYFLRGVPLMTISNQRGSMEPDCVHRDE